MLSADLLLNLEWLKALTDLAVNVLELILDSCELLESDADGGDIVGLLRHFGGLYGCSWVSWVKGNVGEEERRNLRFRR